MNKMSYFQAQKRHFFSVPNILMSITWLDKIHWNYLVLKGKQTVPWYVSARFVFLGVKEVSELTNTQTFLCVADKLKKATFHPIV